MIREIRPIFLRNHAGLAEEKRNKIGYIALDCMYSLSADVKPNIHLLNHEVSFDMIDYC